MPDGVILRSPRTGSILRAPASGALLRTARAGSLLRGTKGGVGAPARQDLLFGLDGGPFASGLVMDSGPLEGPASWAKAKFWSRTGVSAPRLFVLLLNDEPVASFTVAAGSLPTLQRFSFDPAIGSEDDVPSLALPSPADGQLEDFKITFGSL